MLYVVKKTYFCDGEMAERSNAAVLKTVDCKRSGGSNPSFSANVNKSKRLTIQGNNRLVVG